MDIKLVNYIPMLERDKNGLVITYGLRVGESNDLMLYHFKNIKERDKMLKFLSSHDVDAFAGGRTIWGTIPRTVNVDESLARGEWIWDDWV